MLCFGSLVVSDGEGKLKGLNTVRVEWTVSINLHMLPNDQILTPVYRF